MESTITDIPFKPQFIFASIFEPYLDVVQSFVFTGSPPSYDAIQMENGVVVTDNKEDCCETTDTKKGFLIKKGTAEWNAVLDTPEVRALCSPMQVMSASFAAFTHGGNDVRYV